MKITTMHFCPHCGKETEAIRIVDARRNVYLCIVCWQEPTGQTRSEISIETIVRELEKLTLTLKQI
jgi:DNA-directed RNA polymerase subunit RPC12/RpoP